MERHGTERLGKQAWELGNSMEAPSSQRLRIQYWESIQDVQDSRLSLKLGCVLITLFLTHERPSCDCWVSRDHLSPLVFFSFPPNLLSYNRTIRRRLPTPLLAAGSRSQFGQIFMEFLSCPDLASLLFACDHAEQSGSMPCAHGSHVHQW